MLRAPSAVILAGVLAGPAIAQHDDHGGGGERLGTVRFPTSCSDSVRDDFDRAVALLHSFEFRASVDAFEGVLARDPSCAIAHWGVALGYWGNPFGGARSTRALEQGRAAIEEGRTTGSPTPRERAYLQAVAVLFDDHATVSQRDRILAYEQAMREVHRAHPEDVEAAIFYALALNQTALPTDKSYAAQLEAAEILEPLFARYPDHPGLAHYIIHAYDHPPLASRALDAARRYAEIAPSAPHALHMPSHTFTRVGYWQDSVRTNRASEETAIEQGVIAEALHAMDYQTYAYLQMAEDGEARAALERMSAVATMFDASDLGGAAPPMAGYFAMTAMPARYALERGAWEDAAALPVPEKGTAFTIAMAHFARAIGSARAGRPASARPDVERLAMLRDQLASAGETYWAEQVDIEYRAAAAWSLFAAGEREEALELLRAAADAEDASDKAAVTPGPLAPARELLGEMLLEAGRPREALAEFVVSMQKEPRRFRGTYGAARAAEEAGEDAAARDHYEALLEIAGASESARPELERARRFVQGR